jgi:hypothetical protein
MVKASFSMNMEMEQCIGEEEELNPFYLKNSTLMARTF